MSSISTSRINISKVIKFYSIGYIAGLLIPRDYFVKALDKYYIYLDDHTISYNTGYYLSII